MFNVSVINLTSKTYEVRLNRDKFKVQPSGEIAELKKDIIKVDDIELDVINIVGLPNKERFTICLVNPEVKKRVGMDRYDIVSVDDINNGVGKFIYHTKNKSIKSTVKGNIRFVNLTSHSVNEIIGNNIIPPSGIEARLSMSTYIVGEYANTPIIYSDVDNVIQNLPEPKEGVVYIVSSLVGAHIKNRPDVVVPGNKIPGLNPGEVAGCKYMRSTSEFELNY